MFKGYDDWWERAGRWQRAGRREAAAALRGERKSARDSLPAVRMLMREIEARDAAIMAMLEACPDYDGDLSEFGEEPVERPIRNGALPPQPWGAALRK